jgi:hypothetical protein
MEEATSCSDIAAKRAALIPTRHLTYHGRAPRCCHIPMGGPHPCKNPIHTRTNRVTRTGKTQMYKIIAPPTRNLEKACSPNVASRHTFLNSSARMKQTGRGWRLTTFYRRHCPKA